MRLTRGRAELYPELHATLYGFKTDIDAGDWMITKATHNISNQGFYTALEFEVRLTDWVIDTTTE